MTVYNDVRAAMDTRLSATAGLPANIKKQNTKVDPVIGESHLRSTLIPLRSRPTVIGSNPQKRYMGIYNVLVCVPLHEGAGEALDYADLLVDSYEPSSVITFGSTNVVLDYAEIPGAAYDDDTHHCVPVQIGWHAFN